MDGLEGFADILNPQYECLSSDKVKNTAQYNLKSQQKGRPSIDAGTITKETNCAQIGELLAAISRTWGGALSDDEWLIQS